MRRLFLKLFRRRNLQADLEAELAFHNEMSAANGNPIRLGNAAVIKENAFDLWRFNAIENLWRDGVYTFRSLRRSPAFVAGALLSLALGIGLNTALFSIAVEFLLSQPSVVDARSWVSIQLGGSNHSNPEVVRFLRESGVFQEVVGENWESFANWNDGRETHRIFTVQTTRNYFTGLGIPVGQGRGFGEFDPPNSAIVSDRFWREHPSVVGRSMNLDGRAYNVLGVLPPNHRTLIGFGFSPDVYLPNYLPGTLLEIYARLKPGMSLDQARKAVATLAKRLDKSMPAPYLKYADGIQVAPLAGMERIIHDSAIEPIGLFFIALLVLAGLVFFIACVNVASLMLVRAATRRQEIAVRLSLGASRGRLLQQLLTESLLLSSAGTAAGFFLAALVSRLLARIQLPIPVPVYLQVDPDWRVVSYAAALGIAATIVCGLLPARQSFNHTRPRLRMRRWLVTVQIAVSVIVLATGSLFFRNLLLARAIHPGFNVRDTLRAEVHLPPVGYSAEEKQKDYFDHAVNDLSALPGIEAAAAVRTIPFTEESHNTTEFTFLPTGQRRHVRFHWNATSPAFFKAMEIPLLAGRPFTSADRTGPRVVIVNKNFVEQYLDRRDAIGTSFKWGDDTAIYQIVGVVADTKNMTIGEDDEPQLYQPLAQIVNGRPQIQFVLRSRTTPLAQIAAVQRILRRIEPGAGVEVGTMYSSIGLAFLPSQVGAALMGSIGILGLLLAATGLYGVTAYSVARRTREIGERNAIGATQQNIMHLVLFESAHLLLIGSAIGLFIAYFVTKPLAMFFVPGLGAGDPLSYAAVVMVLTATGVAATLGPVLRAIHVDPVTALRYE
jgi:putative ABC transport system permease protein